MKVSLGQRFDPDGEALVTASRLHSEGQETLFFPEFDGSAASFGRARTLDDTATDRAFGKLSHGPLTIEGAYADRTKSIPTAGPRTGCDSAGR